MSVQSDSPRARLDWGLLGVLCLGAVTMFGNLGDRAFWDDEAETAMLARNVLEYGIPRAYDGENWVIQEGGDELEHEDVFVYHPWLPYYLIAGSFRLFGEGVFQARLPGALIGLAVVWLTVGFFRRLGRPRAFCLVAGACLSLMLPFVLHCRSVKYYAPLALFALLALGAYLRALREWSSGDRAEPGRGAARHALGVALPLIGMFYCNLGLTLCLCLALTAHFVLAAWLVRSLRGQWWVLVLTGALVGAAAAPWVVYSGILDVATKVDKGARLDTMVIGFALRLNLQLVPLLALPLLLVPLIRGDEAHRRAVLSRLCLWLAGGAAVILCPQLTPATAIVPVLLGVGALALVSRIAPTPDARQRVIEDGLLVCCFFGTVFGMASAQMPPNIGYLVYLCPLLAGSVAHMVVALGRRHWAAGALIFALLVWTNALHVGPLRALGAAGANPLPGAPSAWRSYVWDYLHELTDDYRGPTEIASAYLNQHAEPGQTLLVTYGAMPFVFHTELRLIRELPVDRPPDWILLRGAPEKRYLHVLRGDQRHRVEQNEAYVDRLLEEHDYEQLDLGVPNLSLDTTPSLQVHRFRTMTDGPPLYLYCLRR